MEGPLRRYGGGHTGVMEALLEEGCVIVATSNRAPWDLNRQGLHEDLFQHFMQRLLQSCDVLPLSAQQDYRRLLLVCPRRKPEGNSGSKN